MRKVRTCLLLIFLAVIIQKVCAQSKIEGYLIIDTTIWSPIAYLSLIPTFDQMNTMTIEMIIDQTQIDSIGYFSFNTQFLPKNNQLYRIHISKRDDPPASLNIGGRDENHVFFITNRQSDFVLKDTSINDFIKSSVINGVPSNSALQEIDRIASYIDSIGFNGFPMRSDLIRNAINEKLRYYADTCSIPLVALYALYKSQFEKNYQINQQYYNKFNKKWKNEKSTYFVEFRKKTQYKNNLDNVIYILLSSLFFILGYFARARFKNPKEIDKNIIKDLTNQERKILMMIKEGKSNKEISEWLSIELSTVKSHVYSIYSKLNIKSRKDIFNLNLD